MTAFPAIGELVPHQAPILALDRLIEWQPGCAVASLTIRADNPFLQHGRLDAVTALEYMAQAVAACLGMEAYREGGAVRVGMVIACRQMQIERPVLELGETLTIRAEQVRGNDSVSHWQTRTDDASGTPVATATLTLVHGEKPPS
jgi:predicted hotdog family 3-hydroxylacyl-ACP dehydratase